MGQIGVVSVAEIGVQILGRLENVDLMLKST